MIIPKNYHRGIHTRELKRILLNLNILQKEDIMVIITDVRDLLFDFDFISLITYAKILR